MLLIIVALVVVGIIYWSASGPKAGRERIEGGKVLLEKKGRMQQRGPGAMARPGEAAPAEGEGAAPAGN